MAAGANKKTAPLTFKAETDRNSLRRTLRGFADLEKGVDQFKRAEIESARVSQQLSRSNAEQKTGVSRLANEFDELRGEMLQAADAAERLDTSLDQAARQRKISGVAGGSSLRADIGGIGDVETAGRAIGGGLGALGFTQADRAIAVFSELPATIEAVGQLKQAIGKDMKLAFDALKNSIGGAGLGLIGATVALAAAYALASSATAKQKEAKDGELEARNEFARIVRTQTSEQIQERLAEIAVEQEIIQAQKQRAAFALANAQAAREAQGILLQDAIQLADALNISDAALDALKIEAERTANEVGKLATEAEVLGEALGSPILAARELSAQFGEAGPAFKAELKKLLKDGLLGSTIDPREFDFLRQLALGLAEPAEGQIEIADRLKAALGADTLARTLEADVIQVANRQLEISRENRDLEKRAARQAEEEATAAAAKQAAKNFNIAQSAAKKFAKLQEEISKIQEATSVKLVQIASALAAKRIEAAIKLEQSLETARRVFAERRLKIQETFQDALFRAQRQFSRSQQTAVGERDALAAHNAALAASDQQEDANRQRDTALRDQRRAEVERLRILRQSLDRQLRTQAAAAARQIRTAIQAAQAQIAIRQQQMQAETAIMAQFAVSGVRSVQLFVAGALGALGALASAAGGAGSSSLNNVIDNRIEQTFGGGGGGGGRLFEP